MSDIAAAVVVVTALFAYANYRFVRLPMTVGVMTMALAISLVFVVLDRLGIPALRAYERSIVGSIDFSRVLMQGMLAFLLFAGSLQVDLRGLRSYRWQVGALAVLGTLVSALLIGGLSWYVLRWCHVGLPLSYCLVFGALISPTDPISVLGILRTAGAPRSVEFVIAGESLFNDGVGVVLFALALALVETPVAPSLRGIVILFLQQAAGGVALGIALGYAAYRLLRSIDNYQVEILLTIATVTGGYALAGHLGVSGPLAMVVAGLAVGNPGRTLAMSKVTREHVDMFWELVDAALNAVLFVLIGFEVALLHFSGQVLLPALCVLLIALMVRLLIVASPIALFRNSFGLPPGSWKVLTWGGLRGGISVALALSLQPSDFRDTIVTLTYIVVVFSIVVQGLTFGWLVKRTLPCAPLGVSQRDCS